MAIFPTSAIPSAAGAGGYSIDQSLRFNDDDSAYLSRTPSSAGNRKTWTWSGWVKRGELGDFNYFFEGQGSSTGDQFSFGTGDNLSLYGEGNAFEMYSTAKFRDPSAWYHIVIASDTTQATAADRIKAYVNGEQITDWSTASYVAQNRDGNVNNNTAQYLGKWSGGSTRHLDGYLAEVNFIDGQALSPTDFGESGDYGEWKPIEYTGTYGTNGFYLDFGNTAAAHTITANGNAQHSTSQSKIGSSSIALDGSGDYLTIPDSDDWKLSGDFTIEGWSRQTSNGTGMMLCHSNYDGNMSWLVGITGQDGLRFVWYPSGSNGSESYVNAGGTWNTGTWYHWAVSVSGTTARFYQDGVLLTSSTMSINPFFDSSYNFAVGCNFELGNAANFYDGYLDEIRVSSTARYTSNFTPSTSAFTTDADTELLIHSDTTNGSTTFTDSSTTYAGLGNDQSSNTNNWTTNNLASTDQVKDSPTNNFCTLNVIEKNSTSSITLSEGNLKATSSGGWHRSLANIGMSSGKWYCEVYIVSGSNQLVGFGTAEAGDTHIGADSEGWSYHSPDGNKRNPPTNSSYGSSWTTGDIIGMLYDNGTLSFEKNGVSQGTAFTGITDELFFATSTAYAGNVQVANFGQDSSFAGNKTGSAGPYTDDNGYGDFYYEPPTGFNALCTANLSDPAVIPSEHFNVVTYTGNDSTLVVTSGFATDLFWTKRRSAAANHCLVDTIRTRSKILYSNLTNAEANAATGKEVASFDSTGVTLGPSDTTSGINSGSSTYVSWNWKANGSDVLNENGTIDSQVSANTDAGFSIVSYTGTGSAGTVGHGLSSAPEMVIIKNRDNGGVNWSVYHKSILATYHVYLNATNAKATSTAQFNDTEPTTTVFSVGWSSLTNNSSQEEIAYCFHSVDGYSKVGSYTGNGSSDGTFVYTGFRPKYILWKYASRTGEWAIMDSERDTYNAADTILIADGSNSEWTDSYRVFDFLSNGFKLRNGGNDANQSGQTIIYIAFAEQPFKYTNAR